MTNTKQPTIQDAKRLIAAESLEGMRILGAGISQDCAPQRYDMAASAALGDPDAKLTSEERRIIASFISEPTGEREPRRYTLRVRLTESERARLQARAGAMDLSEYVRQVLGL